MKIREAVLKILQAFLKILFYTSVGVVVNEVEKGKNGVEIGDV